MECRHSIEGICQVCAELHLAQRDELLQALEDLLGYVDNEECNQNPVNGARITLDQIQSQIRNTP